MINAEHSQVNIDVLIHKIQEEAEHRQKLYSSKSGNYSSAVTRLRTSNIEALLNAASAKSQIRTELPTKFRRFPWRLMGVMSKVALRSYAFLFKEQRAVNLSLIQALRESLTVNQNLAKTVSELQTELHQLQEHVAGLNAQMQSQKSFSQDDDK